MIRRPNAPSRRHGAYRLVLFAVRLRLTGCSSSSSPVGGECAAGSDFADGLVCLDGRWVEPGLGESCRSFESGASGCADLRGGPRNCGLCGRSCFPREVCVEGSCQLRRPVELVERSGPCGDVRTDRAHCGQCGSACADGFVCSMGSCDIAGAASSDAGTPAAAPVYVRCTAGLRHPLLHRRAVRRRSLRRDVPPRIFRSATKADVATSRSTRQTAARSGARPSFSWQARRAPR